MHWLLRSLDSNWNLLLELWAALHIVWNLIEVWNYYVLLRIVLVEVNSTSTRLELLSSDVSLRLLAGGRSLLCSTC